MSQKEQLAKLVNRVNDDPGYVVGEAVEAAFLLGAQAMQEKAVESIPDRYFFTKEWIKKFKPEELL